MIYLRRKLIAAARAMQQGIEPKEPWMPHTYHYHSASAIIENGDFEGAVARAKEKAKQSLITPTNDEAARLVASVGE